MRHRAVQALLRSTCVHKLHPQPNPSIARGLTVAGNSTQVQDAQSRRGDGAPGLEKSLNDLNRMIGVVALVVMNKTLANAFESTVHRGFPK